MLKLSGYGIVKEIDSTILSSIQLRQYPLTRSLFDLLCEALGCNPS